MKRRSSWILSALALPLFLVVVFVPLSRAQVARISRGALLLPKKLLSLPPRVLWGSMLQSPVMPAAMEQASNGVIVGTSYHNDTSPPLRDIKQLPIESHAEREANENPKLPTHHKDSPDEAVGQDQAVSLPSIPGTILNFDGTPFPGVACNCAPPDTDGEVGSTQYVQIVNEGYQVFNKTTGASVLGPSGISTIWSGFGGVCETNGDGDPIVIYDQLANRWIISQFAGSGVPTDECVAVSVSSDATGAYNRYGFHLGTNFFDYPKLSVWPDAYYMSMNVFNSSGTGFLGPQPFAFDRAKMLARLPATFVSTGITHPPARAAETLVECPGSGAYKVFHFHADCAVPATTTFTLFASPAAAGFTELCPATRACIPQLGGTAADGIGDRVMHRLAYRKFGASESVVGNYTVSSGGVAGIRWFELRNVTAGPVTVSQESTYQPDADWRWMGSAAMDNQANLAIGFSTSSATIFPQIRYAGRLAGDPINTLGQGEAHMFDGTGSQTDTSNRWGDYSAMTVDPVDDCTFWYTQEYYSTTSSFNWRTRIGNFKFSGCTAPATGTAHFVVTICAGGSPLSNALVSIDGSPYGATLADGTYDATLSPGAHTYSVSKATFATVSGNFSISTGATTNIPVCLQGTPVIVAAGSTLMAESCTNGVIDPNENVTVSFNLMNTGGASTSNLVATLQASGGVTPITGPQSYGVIAPGGSAARNFSFTASGTCGGTLTATIQLQDGTTALGNATYTFKLGVLNTITAFSQNFDGVVAPALPAGWTTTASGAESPWVTSTTTPNSAPNDAFAPDPATPGLTELLSPTIAMPAGSMQLTFRNNYNTEFTFDGLVLEISIIGGAFP